jgi:hypothetical protein
MTLIPARGTVEFFAYSLGDDDHPDYPRISIDGPDTWLRPVVALIASDRKAQWTGLDWEPVVVDEVGQFHPVYDYLEYVMGGLHWDHSTHFYRPHIDGPVSDAPRIREASPPNEGEQLALFEIEEVASEDKTSPSP